MKISNLLIACLIATVGTSAFAAKYNLKLGHAVNTTDGQHAAALKMAELVKERTKGEVEITIFPANQLGNDAAMINGVRGGTIDIVSSGASNYNGIVANTAAQRRTHVLHMNAPSISPSSIRYPRSFICVSIRPM